LGYSSIALSLATQSDCLSTGVEHYLERVTAHGTAERVAALQASIQEAAESLQTSPREAKYYRALYHTYLHPVPTQEQAAELLDLPFSTFRRHLKAGVARVTDILWHQEIG
jgi:ribulose kinase